MTTLHDLIGNHNAEAATIEAGERLDVQAELDAMAAEFDADCRRNAMAEAARFGRAVWKLTAAGWYDQYLCAASARDAYVRALRSGWGSGRTVRVEAVYMPQRRVA